MRGAGGLKREITELLREEKIGHRGEGGREYIMTSFSRYRRDQIQERHVLYELDVLPI